MSACKPDCSRPHDSSSSIVHLLRSVQVAHDVSKSWLDISPWSCILWFLLSPSDFSILVILELSDDLLEWEWAKALTSQNSNIVDSVLFSLRLKVVVNLTRAENHFSHLVWAFKVLRLITDQRQPSCARSEVFDVRASTLQSQELLWSDHNQRLSEWKSHLGSQQVEVIGRS